MKAEERSWSGEPGHDFFTYLSPVQKLALNSPKNPNNKIEKVNVKVFLVSNLFFTF